MFSRRQFLHSTAQGAMFTSLSCLLPAWARSASDGNMGVSPVTASAFDLVVDTFPVTIGGRTGKAVGVNGTLPAPLIRFREGEEITLNVTNGLDEDTSIHWHGLLVPFQMDGVPGVTFPGIRPGQTFTYKYAVPQSGTYWYHSHSGLQEQQGHYGPIIIDPKDADPVSFDREYVLVLSDWSFTSPYRIFAELKKASDTLNYNKRTLPDFLADAKANGLGTAWSDRAMWGQMRMSPRDIADVTGETYHYLINGHATSDNWNGVFNPGERVRLRIINASAMTLFNVRMPGLPMTIVASDGLNVQPLEVDEFQMGVAETYDVIIEPKEQRAYAFVAESIDRSGQAVATFGPRPGMRAEAPPLRAVPTLTMKDMGMDHGSMSGGDMQMDHGDMDHSTMDHAAMGHDMSGMDHGTSEADWPVEKPHFTKGPGIANIAMMPMSRLDEPGIGLEDVSHRVLRYSQLRSLTRNLDLRAPQREVEIHLTSNMERYMWSFDGVKFSEVTAPITFHEGERLRVTLVNNTMMPHPIHLHGMFFDLVNGGGDHAPRKHTVIVKPAEKLSFDVSADHVGDWAFHCHLLYHMHAGMMQVVSVLPDPERAARAATERMHAEHMADGKMSHDRMTHDTMNHEDMDHEDGSGMNDHNMHTAPEQPPPSDHHSMDHTKMDHGSHHDGMKPGNMKHGDMDHSQMDHSTHGEAR
ncbi:MAG: copper-binding protein [Hirschia sp.]|nr:copper-binding protein [Hirschia sp.]MBF18673.1 copper-binding protein [Hirschia sp.]|tara:strand:+ start:222 stop:2300 length:2079 start_codon:yes stop_codon:yes gene_type:complete